MVLLFHNGACMHINDKRQTQRKLIAPAKLYYTVIEKPLNTMILTIAIM